MNPIRKLLLVLPILVLPACAPPPQVGGGIVATIAGTSVGQSLINALVNSLAPGINTAIANGVAVTKKDRDMVVYALPWLQQALDYFGPALGVSAANIARYDAEFARVEALVANPPTDAASAIMAGVQLWKDVTALLKPALSTGPAS